MNRRELLTVTGAALAGSALAGCDITPAPAASSKYPPPRGKPVKPPANGPVQIAFLVGPDTTLIDVAGPWEAFNDAMVAIKTYLVAPSMDDIDLGGMRVRPDYTIANAPQPHVLVVPATKHLPESIAWVKATSAGTDITMSVCAGAFIVAKAGLFDGELVTTHHGMYARFEKEFPNAKLVRGPRFVENATVSSSGGETSGIDLALRVVERYFGKDAAASSADTMEFVPTPRPS
jgi:transcriptional regulator GlxA family with amidase domain